MLAIVLKYIIERHQSRADRVVAFSAAVLRVSVADQPVDWLREKVIDVEALAVIDGFDVVSFMRLFEKAMRNESLLPVDKVVELPAQKVAGVGSHEVQERGLAFRVRELCKS